MSLILFPLKLQWINTAKQRWFFTHHNYVGKNTVKRGWFFPHQNNVEIKKYVETTKTFGPTKLRQKKMSKETTWIFWPLKLHWKKYLETMWIFGNAKFFRKNNVGATWIFDHRNYIEKSTWKQCGSSSKLGLRCIDVIPTSNQPRFDVVCPLGNRCIQNCLKKKNSINK